MKKIYLWWQSARKYILLDVFLMFAITVSIYSLSNAFGVYRMLTLEQELLNNALENDKSGYFKSVNIFGTSDESESGGMLEKNKEWYESIKALRNRDVVEAVHTSYYLPAIFNDTSKNDPRADLPVHIIPEESKKLFPDLYEGEWPETPFDSEGNLNAVVQGSFAGDLEIGSVLQIEIDKRSSQKIKICGKLYNSHPYPAYTGGGSEANAEMIYNNSDGYIAFMYECEETMEYMWESVTTDYYMKGDSFLLEFTKDASDDEVESTLDELARIGGVSYIKDISARSKEMSDNLFKERMTVPIFYTVISFCAFICITILYIIKRTKEYATYHLLGYSKRKITASIVSRIIALISLATAFNVAYVKNYYALLQKGIVEIDMRPPYFDDFSIALIISICAIMLVFALATALCTLNSRAPIDLQRVSKE